MHLSSTRYHWFDTSISLLLSTLALLVLAIGCERRAQEMNTPNYNTQQPDQEQPSSSAPKGDMKLNPELQKVFDETRRNIESLQKSFNAATEKTQDAYREELNAITRELERLQSRVDHHDTDTDANWDTALREDIDALNARVHRLSQHITKSNDT